VNGSSKKKPSSQTNGVKSSKKVSGAPVNYETKKSLKPGTKKSTMPVDDIQLKSRKSTAINGANKD
jgi:hypothetical protein